MLWRNSHPKHHLKVCKSSLNFSMKELISAALAQSDVGAAVSDIYLKAISFFFIPPSCTVPGGIGLLGSIVPSAHIGIIPASHAFLTPNIFLWWDKAKTFLTRYPTTNWKRPQYWKRTQQQVLRSRWYYKLNILLTAALVGTSSEKNA